VLLGVRSVAGVDQRELVAELYRTPPAEFVAARNAKAAELKKAGEKELAAEVAKLRRHSPAHWALDVLAHTQRALVDTWADAADRVREAQRAAIEGRAGEDLREVLTELRRHTAALAEAAPDGAPVAELPATLAAVAASEEATAELRAGLLGAGLPADDSIFGGGTSAPARRAKKPAAKKPSTAKAPAPTKKAGHLRVVPSPRDDSKLRRQLDEATRAADDARTDLEMAEADADDAAAEESAAEAEVASTAEAIDTAREAVSAAESAHRDAKQRAAAAHKAQAAAEVRLERARAAAERAVAKVAAAQHALDD